MANPKHERFAVALNKMITGMEEYITAHKLSLESDIAEDYLFGPEIQDIAKSIVCLLSGERGSLDGGDTWRRIDTALKVAGFEKGLEE
jgi:hypothetical protein